jgi:hypothetical protein
MLELAIPLRDTIDKSALHEMTEWFSDIPSHAAWYVVSDYCFDDDKKKSDVASFSIILNHDTLASIGSYISAFAPKDLKNTKYVSPDFLKYINAPVIFSFTFAVEKDSRFLKDYASKENMEEFFEGFEAFVQAINKTSYFKLGYIDGVLRRAREMRESLKAKNANLRLSRQIFLVATFASVVFHYLNKVKYPSHIAWVSDRDALIDRGDGFIYDLSYFMFLAEYMRAPEDEITEEKVVLDKPQFIYPIPPKSGINEYDVLVRIPDYLAGTLADLDISANEFSKDKYYAVFEHALVNSRNHAIIHIRGESQNIYTRRLVYRQ